MNQRNKQRVEFLKKFEPAKKLTSMLMGEFRQIEGVRETQTLIAVEE